MSGRWTTYGRNAYVRQLRLSVSLVALGLAGVPLVPDGAKAQSFGGDGGAFPPQVTGDIQIPPGAGAGGGFGQPGNPGFAGTMGGKHSTSSAVAAEVRGHPAAPPGMDSPTAQLGTQRLVGRPAPAVRR